MGASKYSNLLALLFLHGMFLSLPLPMAAASSSPSYHPSFPSSVTLRAGILTQTVPLAFVDESAVYNIDEDFPIYRGFQPDLLRALQRIALEFHNVTLTFDITTAPAFSYLESFDLLAQDCNTTINPNPLEDCNKYEFLVGDYYAYYPRPLRAPFTPALLATSASAIKYAHRKKRDIATLAEAEARQEPVCLHNDSFYDGKTLERYPQIQFFRCRGHEECLKRLKAEECVLMVEDELQLRYLTVQDPELEVTRESFDEQYVLWPMNARLDPLHQKLLVTLIYRAKEMGILDALYDKFFSVSFCPLGWAGAGCALPCNPSHGISNRFGQCVCDSTRWSGDDCATEVQENLNLLPQNIVRGCYALVAVNFLLVFSCGVWLVLHRKRAQVKIAQPDFLLLILIGCVISTSTIVALAQEDEGDGPVRACMAIPWLYSVGFSITFGALFSKIRRIYILLGSAARMKRVSVSFKETVAVVAVVLAIDVCILTVWTIVDPLQWHRTVTNADKYGYALESEGYCQSDHWLIFAGVIATFHMLLLGVACYMCYLARGIPNRFSNGKYVAIAMCSNMQIFIVAIPILVILGSDPQASFFVRSVAIWMNDFVVVTLIFGSLIYQVHRWDQDKRLHQSRMDSSASIQKDIRDYAKAIRKGSHHSSGHTKRDSSTAFTVTTTSRGEEGCSPRVVDSKSDHACPDHARGPKPNSAHGELKAVAEDSSWGSAPSMHEDLAESQQSQPSPLNNTHMLLESSSSDLTQSDAEKGTGAWDNENESGPRPKSVDVEASDRCEESPTVPKHAETPKADDEGTSNGLTTATA